MALNISNLPADQTILFNLLLEANKSQTLELKKELKLNIQKFNTELEIVQENVSKLGRNYLALERSQRKNNIVLFGLNSSKENLLDHTLNTLNKYLETNITNTDINNIYQIGKSATQPIVIQFVTFLKKQTLFQNKEKLQTLREHGLSITNDLCKEDQDELKVLRKHLKNAKAQNLEANIKGYFLFIAGERYSAEDLKQIEVDAEKNKEENDVFEDEDIEEETEKTDIDSNIAQVHPTASKARKGSTTKKETKTLVERPESKTLRRTKRKRTLVYQYSPTK
ncbi:unnamed protein product [Ceutorhynchus assimilis]|uniref:Uncharacterized protein n=1 Tax=Ceutorhynchus assimilis TaxID=467358 RepID=A0A9N9M8K7_9CUCU|nr:unnamed protein product [Ceutorhynchus assimilis]